MITRYFMYDVHTKTFTETTLETEVELTDDRALVIARSLAVTPGPDAQRAPQGWTLSAEDYAGPYGFFGLSVSQELPVALALFGAALAAADAHADGALALPSVA